MVDLRSTRSQHPKKMKIVYHHRTRGAQVEGVHIRGIVGALRELGHDVKVISFPGADPERTESPTQESTMAKTSDRASLLRALVRRLPEPVFEILELGYNLLTLARLGAGFLKARPDFVYERYSLFLFATVWLCRSRDIPVVLEINDSALVERVRPLAFQRIAKRIERWVFRNATGLVFISNYFQDLAASTHGKIAASVVSPNATDCDVFDPERFDRLQERKRLGVEDKLVCGYVGAFVHWHGIDWFVRQVLPTLRATENLVLLLVGDGVAYTEIESLVKQEHMEKRILLTGRVPHDKVASLISSMDFAILPDSNTYGSPMKVFEFMAMGVAVVAPDYGPLRDVIQDGRTGWLFPAKDKQACIDRIDRLAKSSQTIPTVGKAARQFIRAERQWLNNAHDLLSLLKDKPD